MTKQGHTKEDLVEYLLGSVSEADGERFDALSVSDREFADELSAVETDLVDAYVQGELSGDRLTRFESHYLASPLRRDKVEFAKALQTYGQNQGAEAMAPAVVAAQPEHAPAGFWAWLRLITNQSMVGRWSLAAAASLLLAAGAWWIFQSGGNPAVVSFVLTPPMRGHDQITTHSIARRTAEVRIQLQLESDDYFSYHVSLKDEASVTEVWRSGTLTVASDGENKVLEVRVPAKLLESKIYTLVVSGLGRDGTSELLADYPFRAEIK